MTQGGHKRLRRLRLWLWKIPWYARLRTEWRKFTGAYNPTREDDTKDD